MPALQDIDQSRAAGPGLDDHLQQASSEALAKARASAMTAAEALMLSDAPLLFPPGQLALAAVRSGLRKVQFWLVLVLLSASQQSSSHIEHISSAAYGLICCAAAATSHCTAVWYTECTAR